MATPWNCLSLHFSPRGEAKCVRGPSGRGESRAEEKGARRRTCRIASFTPRVKKHGLCGRCVRRGCARDAQSETPPGTPRTPPGRCFPARHGAAMARLGGILPPEPVSARRPHWQHGLLGFYETRDTDFIAVRVAIAARGSHHEKPPPGHGFREPVRVAWSGIARQGAPRSSRSAPSAGQRPDPDIFDHGQAKAVRLPEKISSPCHFDLPCTTQVMR